MRYPPATVQMWSEGTILRPRVRVLPLVLVETSRSGVSRDRRLRGRRVRRSRGIWHRGASDHPRPRETPYECVTLWA